VIDKNVWLADWTSEQEGQKGLQSQLSLYVCERTKEREKLRERDKPRRLFRSRRLKSESNWQHLIVCRRTGRRRAKDKEDGKQKWKNKKVEFDKKISKTTKTRMKMESKTKF
jgi:hypothetical protein